MANSDIQPYPFMFDPSQWTNKFSNFQGQALPWPTQYAGTPTDAQGNPIAGFPSMAPNVTLNSAPTAAPTGAPDLSGLQLQRQMMQANPAAFGNGMQDIEVQRQMNAARAAGIRAQAAQPAAAAPAQTGPNMSQAYLQALANPGRVVTPGATVPQAAPPSNQSNVLQQFLQNWKPGANPAGNYNPNLFVNALRGNV